MDTQANQERREEKENQPKPSDTLPKKNRKREPEVIIAPTQPGGPDITVE